MLAIEDKGDYVLVHLRVQPKASRNALKIDAVQGIIRVALTAPPVDGAANGALCAFVAKVLDLPKRAVLLVGGEKAREKTLRLTGLSAADIHQRLAGMTS